MAGFASYHELLQEKSFEELKKLRDELLVSLRSYENHTELDHLDIDIDQPSADTIYLKEMLRLSQVLTCMAEKFAEANHIEISRK